MLGFVLVNYNCTFLDTSPITIGAGTMIAPGCVLACAGHAIHPAQRAEGVVAVGSPCRVLRAVGESDRVEVAQLG